MMKLKICIMINSSIGLYTFRKEFLEELIKEGYEVYVLALPSEKKKDIENIGCKFIDVNVDRRGTNILNDFKLFIKYYKILKKEKIDLVLTYTVKPNIYGGIAARILKIDTVHTVTRVRKCIY